MEYVIYNETTDICFDEIFKSRHDAIMVLLLRFIQLRKLKIKNTKYDYISNTLQFNKQIYKIKKL